MNQVSGVFKIGLNKGKRRLWLDGKRLSNRELAARLIRDWPTWSEGKCPYSRAELRTAFAALREEMQTR